jgi:hypothetical protein
MQHGKPCAADGTNVQLDAREGQTGRHRVTERLAVCGEQRGVQEGSSPSDARMRGVISESGVNSLAGRRRLGVAGGQGVHREVGSEGHGRPCGISRLRQSLHSPWVASHTK